MKTYITPLPPSRRVLLRERGSTTLISLLVLFALMGLGMLSLRFTHQEISSAGNLRQAKQARYVAEIGLHHVITLLQQQGNYLLNIRQNGEFMQIKSDGTVEYYSRDNAGVEKKQRSINLPAFSAFAEGPAALGLTQNRVPSYEIRVDGITDGPTPPGQELSQSDLGTPRQSFCLVHFNARGYIAESTFPETQRDQMNEETWRASLELLAEHRLKAGVIIGPFLIPGCEM